MVTLFTEKKKTKNSYFISPVVCFFSYIVSIHDVASFLCNRARWCSDADFLWVCGILYCLAALIFHTTINGDRRRDREIEIGRGLGRGRNKQVQPWYWSRFPGKSMQVTIWCSLVMLKGCFYAMAISLVCCVILEALRQVYTSQYSSNIQNIAAKRKPAHRLTQT